LSRPDVKVGIWSLEERNLQSPRAHEELFYSTTKTSNFWHISNSPNVEALPSYRVQPPTGAPQCDGNILAEPIQLTAEASVLLASPNSVVDAQQVNPDTVDAAQIARLQRECIIYMNAINNDGGCTLWDYGNTDGSCMDEKSLPPFMDTEVGSILGEALCTAAWRRQSDRFIPKLQLNLVEIYSRQRDLRRAEEMATMIINEMRHGTKEAAWKTFDEAAQTWVGGAPEEVQWEILHLLISTFLAAQNFEVAEELVDFLATNDMFETMRAAGLHPNATRAEQKASEHIRATRPLIKIRVGKYKEAAFAIREVIEHAPLDFLMGFILQYLLRHLKNKDLLTHEEVEVLQQASDAVDERYKARIEGSMNKFNDNGRIFDPPIGVQPDLSPYNSSWRPSRTSPWQPVRLNKVPTPAEFLRYVTRREPFIVSMKEPIEPKCSGHECAAAVTSADHCPSLFGALHWENACKWDAEYMCEHAGTEPISLSNVGVDHDEEMATICGSPTNVRTQYDYCTYVKAVFEAGRTGSDVTRSIGYFDASAASSNTFVDHVVYGFPLNVLINDIPTPEFLDRENEFYKKRVKLGYVDPSNPEIVDINVANVLFWMGAATKEKPGQSGLHFDVLDNFHVMLRGTKVRDTPPVAWLL